MKTKIKKRHLLERIEILEGVNKELMSKIGMLEANMLILEAKVAMLKANEQAVNPWGPGIQPFPIPNPWGTGNPPNPFDFPIITCGEGVGTFVDPNYKGPITSSTAIADPNTPITYTN